MNMMPQVIPTSNFQTITHKPAHTTIHKFASGNQQASQEVPLKLRNANVASVIQQFKREINKNLKVN